MTTHLPFQPITQATLPDLPDTFLCHPFYGRQLRAADCALAAGQLPTGSEPVEFGYRSGAYQPYDIPFSITYQSCQVRVEWAYPDSRSDLSNAGIQVIPENVRNVAGGLLNHCVRGGGGIGGFATIGIQNMISFLTDYATTTLDIGNGPWPAHAAFLTVSVSGPAMTWRQNPGLYEPEIARYFSRVMTNSGKLGGGTALATQAEYMRRGDVAGWWQAFSTNEEEMESDSMAYSCDAKLGSPVAVDCEKLSYSELGAPSDSVTIGPAPGAGKTLSLNSCQVAITSIATVTLTWAQIGAALDTLIDSCVADPFNAATGGVASASTSTQVTVGKGGSKRKRDTQVTGLNALPPGVNITVSSS